MASIVRTKIPRQLLLFLMLALAATSAPGAALDDSAHELARKIAANLPAGASVTLQFRNESSLTSADAAQAQKTIEQDLLGRGFHLNGAASPSATVSIVFSANLKGFVWSAEIRPGEVSGADSTVVMLDVPRPVAPLVSSTALPLTLHVEKFWEGPDRILDAAFITAPDGSGRWLLLLEPGSLAIRKGDAGPWKKLALPPTNFRVRDPIGRFLNLETSVVALIGGEGTACTFLPDLAAVGPCHALVGVFEWPGPPLLREGASIGISEWLSQKPSCGSAAQELITGAGDYTQPDYVQVVEASSSISMSPQSPPLDFPGPVLALRTEPSTVTPQGEPLQPGPRGEAQPGAPLATVIVHNLKTRNYEAYKLSFSCNQ